MTGKTVELTIQLAQEKYRGGALISWAAGLGSVKAPVSEEIKTYWSAHHPARGVARGLSGVEMRRDRLGDRAAHGGAPEEPRVAVRRFYLTVQGRV